MQKYIHYEKWTGLITGHTREKSDRCIKADIPADNIYSYRVFEDKLYKRDNLVRIPLEKKFSTIEYGKNATVKLNIFPDKEILKITIDKYFIESFIDAYQFDKIQFIHPVLKIYVHSKKGPELLGTLEIDLNEYFKTEKYEQDISTILSKTNVTNLVFKTQRCFEKYAYEIIENKTFKAIDRNLIDDDYHIIVDYWPNRESFINEKYRVRDGIIIQNNIKYWQEFEHILNNKIIISFIDKKNPTNLEYYIFFTLKQLQEQESLSFDKPYNIILTNKTIHCNYKQLKIKYENTSN